MIILAFPIPFAAPPPFPSFLTRISSYSLTLSSKALSVYLCVSIYLSHLSYDSVSAV